MNISLESASVVLSKKKLLDNIDLKILPGQLTLLIGPNGAGKSTLLKACIGDLPLTSGSAILNEQPMQHYSAKQLSSLRAVMTQEYSMSFSFTVRHIVSMGCFTYEEKTSTKQQDTIIDEVMAFMHIDHLAERHFATLSGGEQQRTQLARVFTQLWSPYEQAEPRYLFLDEPTASLDIFHQYQVMSLTKELAARNIGVLAVVHDLSLAASFADQLVLLSNGQIVTSGSPDKVLQKEFLIPVYGISGYYFQSTGDVKPSILIENTC